MIFCPSSGGTANWCQGDFGRDVFDGDSFHKFAPLTLREQG